MTHNSTSSLPTRNTHSLVSTSSTDTETTVISSRPKHEPSAPPKSTSSTMEKEDWPPKLDELDYVNVSGSNGSVIEERKDKAPPQVPPKPKLRQPIQATAQNNSSPTDEFSSGGGFVPTVTSTTLFSNYKKDEIVRF